MDLSLLHLLSSAPFVPVLLSLCTPTSCQIIQPAFLLQLHNNWKKAGWMPGDHLTRALVFLWDDIQARVGYWTRCWWGLTWLSPCQSLCFVWTSTSPWCTDSHQHKGEYYWHSCCSCPQARQSTSQRETLPYHPELNHWSSLNSNIWEATHIFLDNSCVMGHFLSLPSQLELQLRYTPALKGLSFIVHENF